MTSASTPTAQVLTMPTPRDARAQHLMQSRNRVDATTTLGELFVMAGRTVQTCVRLSKAPRACNSEYMRSIATESLAIENKLLAVRDNTAPTLGRTTGLQLEMSQALCPLLATTRARLQEALRSLS